MSTPALPVVMPDDFAEHIADELEAGTFLICSVPEAYEAVARRGADVDGNLAAAVRRYGYRHPLVIATQTAARRTGLMPTPRLAPGVVAHPGRRDPPTPAASRVGTRILRYGVGARPVAHASTLGSAPVAVAQGE